MSCSTSGIHRYVHVIYRLIFTHGDTSREKIKGQTNNQYKTTTSVFLRDTYPIDDGNKANIQLKIYTLQKRKPLDQLRSVRINI